MINVLVFKPSKNYLQMPITIYVAQDDIITNVMFCWTTSVIYYMFSNIRQGEQQIVTFEKLEL